MPHATECAANLLNNNASVLPVLPSSPIPIPGSAANGYGRNSSSSHNASAVVTRATTINDITDFDPLSLQDSDKMNISFDSFSAMFSSDETAYASTITPDPVSRNSQPSYLRDYNCCGVDHQNLVELLQHVDNYHPGWIFDMVNGVVIPFETSTVYSQDRWDSIPTPVSSVSTPLTTNGSAHEQKSNSFNTITSASLYSINIPSSINQKHKGNVNNNGLGHYNQGGIGQINRYDQINSIEQINGTMTNQNQDLSNWMLACQLSLLYNSNSTNPLRDPNLSSTLIGDQTFSSNSSSISTSLDDDKSLFDVPSKSLHQDPLLVSPLLSISSYPPTPIDCVDSSTCLQSSVSSPISSDDNSVVVSPILNDQTTTISKLANIDNDSQRRSSTLSLQNTSYGSINNSTSNSGQGSDDNDSNSVNSQQRRTSSSSITSDQQTSYGSINNISNSRQRPISPISNDVRSHISRPSSFDNTKIQINSDNNKTLPIVPRRSSSSNQSVSSTSPNNCHSYVLSGFLQTTPSIDGSSIAQPRRSSTTIIPSQSVTTASQNEQQYGSINISGLGQASSNNNNNIRPVVPLRRSSTSNVTTARSIATTSQVYCPLNISIDKSKFATYMPSVTAAQYVNVVDGYHSLVGHVSSREAGSGAVAQFAAKYHPIQPKAGVAMSDVYTDPALDMSGMKGSKKRTVSTSSIDAKSTKRRVTKTDESVADTPVGVMSADLSEVENKNETDIYPYKCVVPGCPKVYKNANGLKYHNEHGHASQSGNGAREKPWACHIVGCLKTYGSKGGLVYHVKHCHPNDLWALP